MQCGRYFILTYGLWSPFAPIVISHPGVQVSPVAKATAVMLEDGSTVDVEGALKQLDDMVAVEDPHSGDCIVRLLQQPFIQPEESEEVASWQL